MAYMTQTAEKVKGWLKHHVQVRVLLVLLLVVLCVLELQAIVEKVREAEERQDKYFHYQSGMVVRSKDVITPEEIEPWMTFSYINFVFKLPRAYLIEALGIDDAQYPDIQINRYARLHGIDSSQLIEKIRAAVVSRTH